MNWYLSVLKKYAVFTGRAGRPEFWFFMLFNIIAAIILGIIDGVLGLSVAGAGLLGLVYSLGVLVPSLAVGARRLHDTGRSGWWQLIGLIPLIGFIVLIVFFVMESHRGDNKYGSNPN